MGKLRIEWTCRENMVHKIELYQDGGFIRSAGMARCPCNSGTEDALRQIMNRLFDARPPSAWKMYDKKNPDRYLDVTRMWDKK